MDNARCIWIEVVHVGESALFQRRLALPAGSTVADALARAGVAEALPGLDLSAANVGVFSRKVGLDHVLADDDRVEVYRPLRLTPNEARKLRAERRRGR